MIVVGYGIWCVSFLFAEQDIPSSGSMGTPSTSPSWAVEGQEKKEGAGILFFAYGSPAAVNQFLVEASIAARSFRNQNPRSLNIGIVTNNATVDKSLFSHHIRPREDLLFAGSDCPYGPKNCQKNVPRQWLTRLYYMAHSPFVITWALDSNVINCASKGVASFLDAALASNLWGYDIAHPSQAADYMYPHNWNIMYRWNVRVSSMMRDWLLLQLRRGITTDDQATLHAAELRGRSTNGLRVGQVPNAFAAAFYSGLRPKFFPRITRTFTGPVYVLHAKTSDPLEWCQAFNSVLGPRQVYRLDKSSPLKLFQKVSQCKETLKVGKCPLAGANGNRKNANQVFEPPKQMPPEHYKFTF
mmetsp:Transcript_53619/g.116891  ORF Transcript_53619/g.116891 Transcript_53619/m.116891 type:complete len:356 (+) Transcript_53619:87-1154(+)|eukprot:3960574-Pleurochrysis_carterae.AAC.3